MSDFRDAYRALKATPIVTIVAILSLALGIGANTAIFSILNGLLLRSLPVKDPGQLVVIRDGSWTNPIWEQIRERQNEIFDGAFAFSGTRFNVADRGETQFVEGLWASGRLFDVLGVPAILGRTLTPEDDVRGGGPNGPAAVISYAFWQRRYGGAADMIGKTLTIERVPFTIVGVTPPDFFGPEVGRTFDVVIPIGAEPLVRGKESFLDRRSTWWLNVFARMKPGQTLETATQALRIAQPQIREATIPPDYRAQDVERYLNTPLTLDSAGNGTSGLRRRYQQPLLAMMVVVGLVLLIACANIANLLLARASARRHELSIRLALGASRARLARQLLIESLMLAFAGAVLGLIFAKWAGRLLVNQLATPGSQVSLDLSIDWRILAFTSGVAILTALIFGIVPALGVTRLAPNDALKDQGRTVSGDRRFGFRNALVIAQVALSVVLVVAAGLFVRTLTALLNVRLGFNPDSVIVVNVNASRSGTDATGRPALAQRLSESVSAVPGVARAAVSFVTPLSGMAWNNLVEVPGGPQLSERDSMSYVNAVTPGWFETYGTRLISGRDFDERDKGGSPLVVIVNQAFARKFMNGQNPIGRTLRQTGSKEVKPFKEVVGLVEDAVYRSVRLDIPPTMYFPFSQIGNDAPSSFALSVRAAAGQPPALLTKGIVDASSQVNQDLALTFRTLTGNINASMTQERLVAILSGFFGVLALLLAALGLYGVTSYAVSRQQMEIGIRLALGADGRRIIRLVLTRVMWLIAIGLFLGAILSLWAARFSETLLFGLKPRDPLTLIGAIAVLALAGLLAGWLPARRASRMDPARILRSE
jgi:putative ABC transport system permease protein